MADLSFELIAWAAPEDKKFGCDFPLGIVCDLDSPAGDAAIGWRVELVEEGTMDFISGLIEAVDAVTGDYTVVLSKGKKSEQVRVPAQVKLVESSNQLCLVKPIWG